MAIRWFGPALTMAALLAGSTAFSLPARAADTLPVELNKLEPIPQAAGGTASGVPASGCRAYIVARNPDAQPLEQLRLDLVLFGTDGVIARRLAVDLGPLGAEKTAVRLFDLPGLGCADIGRVLVNDVLACRTGGATPADQDKAACLDRLTLTSRAAAPLAK